MKSYQIGTVYTLLIAVFLGFQNCAGTGATSSANPSGSGDVTHAQIETRYALIKDINQRSLGCNQDSDCTVVPVGARPCGGPSDYLVASNLSAELPQVLALASELDAQEAEYNAENNMVGSCEYLMPPVPSCVKSLCQ